ncbi:NADH dehydrogenase [Mucilaginibacter sp. PPCGB 2223]|uniref:NADH-quinone oxidoreductase subunit J family protein n=1 Tax=Mucilaginibacter sp. PPCGB 2223 TaxID=1886027 RepID=UPI000824BC27|nr:NADH-quinone oxidoreductase subunit J [Mucilaginibacter sp. PPCGB 2223]OCX54127.1 NADH dehydrogenase [Mucilaginibacter sp. PPCGB 2223]
MNINQVLFYVMGFTALASALIVAASKNLVRSVFMFFVTLFALAGLYVFALADFVAVTQIVIYVGGVLVLMLFAFMLSNKETLNSLQNKTGNKFIAINNMAALLAAGLFLVILVNAIIKARPDGIVWIQHAQRVNPPRTDNLGNIGVNLMTNYLLPFEVISIILMMALIGAVHLSRKEEHKL